MNAQWGRVKKVCEDNGLIVAKRGSEAVVKGTGRDGRFRMVVIGQKCCRGPSSEVWGDYLNALKRAFRLTNRDFRKR